MGQRVMMAILAAILGSAIAAAPATSVQSAPPATPQSVAAAAPSVDVPAEPLHTAAIQAPATLREAAEANDFAAFDSLVHKARANGEALGAFADLYEVWSFSQANATGAYYGPEMHDRLAARYPAYAGFIEDDRITDSRGQAFYPSEETRGFLLQQAIEGNDPLVAPRAAPLQATSSRITATRHEIAVPAKEAAPLAPPRPIEPANSLPKDALASNMSKVTPPRAPALAQAQRKVVETETVVDTAATTRGIFLIILGLIGIGVLTMTMRASGSDVHVADDEPHSEASVSMAAHDARPTESHG